MADEETQAGSPPVVVPNSIEQSLRDHFERILLISEEAAASLAEQVIEVFTEKEEQAQQLTGRCRSGSARGSDDYSPKSQCQCGAGMLACETSSSRW